MNPRIPALPRSARTFRLLIPSAVLVVSLLAGCAQLGRRPVPPTAPGASRRLAGLVWFAIYLAALPSLGFLLATIPFFAGLMVLYGGARAIWLAVASVAMPVFLFYVFRDGFQILLPLGILPVWFG